MKKIDKRLKKIREKKEISIEELASKLDIKESIIVNWENGTKKPSASNLKKIASALDCKIEDLIDSDTLTEEIIEHESQRRYLIVFIIILAILLGFVTNQVVKYQLKKKEFKTYAFTGESENFNFERGYALFSSDMDFIAISNFDLKKNLDIKSISINIAFNETIWASAEYKNNDFITAEKWLNNLIITEGSRPVLGKADSFIKYDKLNFPDDMKIEINYCLKDNTCHIDVVDISSRRLKPDNKLNIRERYYEET
jgi:transcriptional regulator with XRE-family HTH domain